MAFDKPCVLAIDDNPANLRVLFDLLTENGLHVLISQSGTKGIERAVFSSPDIVLLDINMPGVDGYEVCRILRQKPETEHIPVLFTTAFSDAESKLKGFEAGGTDYITKPFNANEVLARLEVHLANARLRHELAAKNEQLEMLVNTEREATELKQRFFAMATHEFRSPLMTIQLATSMLRRYGSRLSDEDRDEECDTINSMVSQMNKTLTSILSFVRGTRPESTHSAETMVSIENEVARIASLFTTDNPSASLSWSYNGPDEPVCIDTAVFDHAMSNLLSNALKFSPTGEPIEVGVEATSDTITVEVSDRGIGIPSADITTLFKPFMRAANATRLPGNGLGLTIVQQALTKAGGTITVESREGEGSTFRFTLPIASPADTPATDPETT